MLWEILRQNHATELSEQASRIAKETKRNYSEVPDKMAQLSLISQAIWELLKEKHGLDEIDLLNKIEEIDIRDGKLDGKVSQHVVTCLGCSRKIRTASRQCIYCGTQNHKYSPFTKLSD